MQHMAPKVTRHSGRVTLCTPGCRGGAHRLLSTASPFVLQKGTRSPPLSLLKRKRARWLQEGFLLSRALYLSLFFSVAHCSLLRSSEVLILSSDVILALCSSSGSSAYMTSMLSTSSSKSLGKNGCKWLGQGHRKLWHVTREAYLLLLQISFKYLIKQIFIENL